MGVHRLEAGKKTATFRLAGIAHFACKKAVLFSAPPIPVGVTGLHRSGTGLHRSGTGVHRSEDWN